MAEDVKEENSPPSGEELETEDELSESEGLVADSEETESEAKPEQRIPYSRFKQINDKLKDAVSLVEFYQKNLGASPDKIRQFVNWVQNGSADAQRAASGKKPLTAEQKQAIREVIAEAYPELAKIPEETEAERKRAEEVMFDRAEREITRLAKDAGYNTKDEDVMETIAELTMHRIRGNKTLYNMWLERDPGVFEMAFEDADKRLKGLARKAESQMVANKRKVKRLPTAPPGGGPTVSPKLPDHNKGKGITADVHKAAWAKIQQAIES